MIKKLALPDDPEKRRQTVLVAQVFVLSRAAMAIVLVVLALQPGQLVTQLLSRWDAARFMMIAQIGYSQPSDPAFFPGLPLLLWAGSKVGISIVWMGVAVALIGSAFAAAALYKMFGAPAACLWLVAPTAVFTFVGYSEAPFCAAAFWAWQRAREHRWGQAAILAGVACAFRISGLFLLAGLAIYALTSAIADPVANDGEVVRRPGAVVIKTTLLRWVWLLIPVAVLGAYMAYLHAITGSWLAWWNAQQQGWDRSLTSPWASLWNTIQAGLVSAWPGRPEVPWVFRAEVISMAAGVAVTVWLLVRRRWAQAVYVGLQVVAFGTSWWYMSVNRAILVWFPLWALLGTVVGTPHGRAGWRWTWRVGSSVLVVASGALMLIWSWLFFTNRWAS